MRTSAEDQLNNEWVSARPDVLLMGLVEQIQESNDASVRLNSSSEGDFQLTKRKSTGTVLCGSYFPEDVYQDKKVAKQQ